VAKNLERFYFKAIHRKFRRLQKRKYIKGIVKGYRQERKMRRIVEEWKKAVDLTKFETEEMNYQMQTRAQYGFEILLEHFCVPHYLRFNNTQLKDSLIYEVVKFHSHALHNLAHPDPDDTTYQLVNGKRKKILGDVRLRSHNIERFNQSVCQVLQYKQKRVFRCW
jgi:hypothetical protein